MYKSLVYKKYPEKGSLQIFIDTTDWSFPIRIAWDVTSKMRFIDASLLCLCAQFNLYRKF